MADIAHTKTDQKLEEMEKRLSAIYSRAEKEIQKTADEYFSKFAKQDEAKRKLLEQGKITEDEYKKWRKGKVMYGKRFTEMKEQCAKQLLNVNQTALAYVNGELPEVYALNYNALADSVDGVGGYSFTLVDADTVRNLAVTDTSLLPYKEIDPSKDIPWNMKKINAETLQGILHGESMDKIAKRLRNVQEMNRTQAIRSARTLVTGAENKGRQDSYARAEADGIILQKEWLATNDGRTRHSHAVLDGAIVDQDKKFDNGLMYPGDPSGRPEEVYNCRCTLVAKVNGFKKAQVQKAMGKEWSTEEEYREAQQKAKSVFEEYDRTFEERYQEERWKIEDSYGGNFMRQRINIRNNPDLTDEQKEIELAKLQEKRKKMNADLEALSERFDKEREEAYERMTGTYDLDYEFKKITGKHSVRFDSESVNPNFSTFQFEYTNNCQRCSVAYELRQRGYDVEAMPSYNGGVGAGAQIKSIFSTAQEFSTDSYGHDATVEMIKQMEEWGSGSRGILVINRADGSGHAYNMQNVNGVVSFVDSQCGSVWDISELGYDTDGGAIENSFSSWLIRTDNAKVHQIPDDYVRDK